MVFYFRVLIINRGLFHEKDSLIFFSTVIAFASCSISEDTKADSTEVKSLRDAEEQIKQHIKTEKARMVKQM